MLTQKTNKVKQGSNPNEVKKFLDDLGQRRQSDSQMMIEVTDVEIKDPISGLYRPKMRKVDT